MKQLLILFLALGLVGCSTSVGEVEEPGGNMNGTVDVPGDEPSDDGDVEDPIEEDPVVEFGEYGVPQAARVQYPDGSEFLGDVAEPFISRDGKVLFFCDLGSPTVSRQLYWAVMIDNYTFELQGFLDDANSDNLDCVPSMDENNVFIMTTTRLVETVGGASLFKGDFSYEMDGDNYVANVENVEPLGEAPLSDDPPPVTDDLFMNMDAEVSKDGETLYYTENIFSGSGIPDYSNIYVAKKVEGEFVKDTSVDYMVNVNTEALEYAPSTSEDELELYFTRFYIDTFEAVIYMATRESTDEPFGVPFKIENLTGTFVEATTISPDQKRLYYHDKVEGTYKLYMVEREEVVVE